MAQKKQTEQMQNETDFPLYLYHHGKNDRVYDFLGAHKTKVKGESGYIFRVWAPHAKSVSVVGDFNGWDASKHVMYHMVDNEVDKFNMRNKAMIVSMVDSTMYKLTPDQRGVLYDVHSDRRFTDAGAGSKHDKIRFLQSVRYLI